MYLAVHPLANLPQTLADQENIMLRAALGVDANPPNGSVPWFTSSDQPAQGMALLSILTHELGHLLLAETNADGTGDGQHTHLRSRLCDKPGDRHPPRTCFDQNFLAPHGVGNTLWHTSRFRQHMRRWVVFDGPTRRNNNQYQDAAHDLDAVIASGNYGTLLSGEFVSFYAAVSPEEDFVETYKYKILADVAQASNLTLNFPGGTKVSVLQAVSDAAAANTNLHYKIGCVTGLTP
jgi:hypothetical protein